MKINPSLATDFYKTGHIFQYPPGTQDVYSNFTARGAQHATMSPHWDGKVVFYGLQGFAQWFLIDMWNEGFFRQPKAKVVALYKRRVDNALGEGVVPVQHIADLHDLGFLPIRIKALPEGSRVNLRVPMVTVRATLPDFFWLTNYIETVLSDELWKPITVATIAADFRAQLDHFVELTGGCKDFAAWQNHDFSMRGMSGMFDASACGSAHLLSGYGTDTTPAIDYLENYYGADCENELVGGSVPASEHAVMCMGGMDDEVGTIRRLITEVYPTGIVSVVSDTWDFWHVITETAKTLKPEIMARLPNALGQAKVVFRPDSGDPVKILTGYLESEVYRTDHGIVVRDSMRSEGGAHSEQVISEAEMKGAVECLWDIFGGTLTDKGFKTLDSHVGLIYGDSITIGRQRQILERLMAKGFSASNVVFGVGSYTYQYITRDTFGMAMKATFGVVDGEARELFKDPITDTGGTKKSAKGLLRVEYEDGDFVLYDQQSESQEEDGELQMAFFNSRLHNFQTLSEIRAVLKQ